MYSAWEELHERMRKQYTDEQEELEVVRPEVLARWRRLGVPEPTIQAIIKQHQRVMEARKLERKIRIPQLNYLVPPLPKVEEEAKVVAMALDTDGWLEERRTGGDRIGRIDRIIYRWEYTVPAIGFETDTYKLTEHIANMLNTAVSVVKTVYLGKVTIMYRTVAWTSRAMRAIQLCEPHFIKWKERAGHYLEKYKSKPSHPIP